MRIAALFGSFLYFQIKALPSVAFNGLVATPQPSEVWRWELTQPPQAKTLFQEAQIRRPHPSTLLLFGQDNESKLHLKYYLSGFY